MSIKTAIITVTNKSQLDILVPALLSKNVTMYSTGNTHNLIKSITDKVQTVSEFTGFNEILNGRVKTLHPKIYSGILARRDVKSDIDTLNDLSYPMIDLVVANLYEFEKATSDPNTTLDDALEKIDIGGPCMIRAAAKNFKDVVVLTNPNQYPEFIERLNNDDLTFEYRKHLASQAFNLITQYDMRISEYLSDNNTIYKEYELVAPLKYGLNPHQDGAGLYREIKAIKAIKGNSKLPFELISGNMGFINMLDAINSWCLVTELTLINPYKVYSASFKHTSPAGVAYNRDISENEELIYGAKNNELENVSRAYLLARNCDPKSSFGDFVALSDIVTVQCARLIKREVCDGIIAPGYDPAALEILQSKKSGNFVILKGDLDYTLKLIQTKSTEIRDQNGIVLVQNSNNVSPALYIDNNHVVSNNKNLTENNFNDLILANTALKYSQSNTVAMSINGQCVIACGQQNRVDCTKLSGEKLIMMLKRQSNQCRDIYKLFKDDVMRQTRINVITDYLEGNHTEINIDYSQPISVDTTDMQICLASDAFFPFEDNIDVANKYGVKHIVQPGGSIRDPQVIDKANSYGMTMICTGNRLFLH